MVRASKIESSQTSESESEEEKYEEYEVELLQPYGLKFAKGRDGRTYIDAIAPGGNADRTNMFTVGDKVLATRFVFPLFSFHFISLQFVLSKAVTKWFIKLGEKFASQ